MVPPLEARLLLLPILIDCFVISYLQMLLLLHLDGNLKNGLFPEKYISLIVVKFTLTMHFKIKKNLAMSSQILCTHFKILHCNVIAQEL